MSQPNIPVSIAQPTGASAPSNWSLGPIAGGQTALTTSGPFVTSINAPTGAFVCLTGTIQPQAAIGIPFAGDFHLVNPVTGQRVAALTTEQVNLSGLTGQVVTVCGVSQGPIEGLTTIRVTSASPAAVQTPSPISMQQLLLSFILSNPALLFQLLSTFQSPFGLGLLGATPIASLTALGSLANLVSTTTGLSALGNIGVSGLSGVNVAANLAGLSNIGIQSTTCPSCTQAALQSGVQSLNAPLAPGI